MPAKAWGQNRANVWASQPMPTINQVIDNSNANNNNNKKNDFEKVKNVLSQYIVAEINGNNCLGLTEDEINGMASELVNSNTRAEVYNWCTTLMMGEPFAAELIKRRTETGPPFAGETLTSSIPLISEPVSAASLTPSSVPEHGTAGKGGKIGGGGKQLSMQATRNTVQTGKNKNVRKPQPSASHNKSPFTQTFNSNSNSMASTLKQGKSECGCFGTVHNIRINCANCGRIICEQESDKWCYYCGLEPSRCLAYEIAVEEGKVSDAAMAQNEEQYNTAIAQRDKLLEYAMHRAKRTTVIDDQAASLFTAQNAWLSPEERKSAQKDAARVEQEARIKALQQHRGAFTVQLQLMGQTVPSAVSKGNPVQIKLSMADDKTKKPTNNKACNFNEEEEEEEQECELEKDEKVNNKSSKECVKNNSLDNSKHNDNQQQYLEEEEENEVEEDEVKIDERAIEAGAAPLPTLLQSIWYNPDNDSVNINNNRSNNSQNNNNNNNNHHYFSFTENAPHGMKAEQPLSSASANTHRSVRRYDELSRRVQQNYFEDDMNTYKEEKIAEKHHNEAIIGLVQDESSVASSKRFDVRHAQGELAIHAIKNNDGNHEKNKSNALQKGEKTGTSPPVEEIVDKRFAAFVPTMQMRNRDDGICLSMHQPWASLLVAGIKRHEGRVWKTEYRGRLWIHAAAAEPVAIAETEQHYAPFMQTGTKFPSHYPTRVLLGYVYLTACLSKTEYEATFKPEERQEESPFSFICSEPRFLPFPLPMSGNHKLFALDHKVHMAAKKQLNEESL